MKPSAKPLSEKIIPSDLTHFAPHGNGVYGYQEGIGNPFLLAPLQDNIGGVLYFGNNVSREEFDALMSITGVCKLWNKQHGYEHYDFVVFYQESENPAEDGYLAQLRIVSRFALRHMFNSLTESEYCSFKNHDLPMSDTLWNFMKKEREKYGTHFGSPKLAGLLDGDGDYAQEQLSFGFMVENNYFGVYRIWSRAWLVTK